MHGEILKVVAYFISLDRCISSAGIYE